MRKMILGAASAQLLHRRQGPPICR